MIHIVLKLHKNVLMQGILSRAWTHLMIHIVVKPHKCFFNARHPEQGLDSLDDSHNLKAINQVQNKKDERWRHATSNLPSS